MAPTCISSDSSSFHGDLYCIGTESAARRNRGCRGLRRDDGILGSHAALHHLTSSNDCKQAISLTGSLGSCMANEGIPKTLCELGPFKNRSRNASGKWLTPEPQLLSLLLFFRCREPTICDQTKNLVPLCFDGTYFFKNSSLHLRYMVTIPAIFPSG